MHLYRTVFVDTDTSSVPIGSINNAAQIGFVMSGLSEEDILGKIKNENRRTLIEILGDRGKWVQYTAWKREAEDRIDINNFSRYKSDVDKFCDKKKEGKSTFYKLNRTGELTYRMIKTLRSTQESPVPDKVGLEASYEVNLEDEEFDNSAVIYSLENCNILNQDGDQKFRLKWSEVECEINVSSTGHFDIEIKISREHTFWDEHWEFLQTETNNLSEYAETVLGFVRNMVYFYICQEHKRPHLDEVAHSEIRI